MKITTSTTLNMGGSLASPSLIVIHWTGGSTLEGGIVHMQNPASHASAHYVIDRDGSVVNLVPTERIAWHAGESAWKKKKYCNSFSIGIELVNAGEVFRAGTAYKNKIGAKAESASVLQIEGRFYHQYTPSQVATVQELCAMLIKKFPSITEIVGHSDVAPGRKSDPGPAFPMSWLQGVIEGRR